MKLSYPLLVLCILLPAFPVTSLAVRSEVQPEGALLIALGDDLDEDEDDE